MPSWVRLFVFLSRGEAAPNGVDWIVSGGSLEWEGRMQGVYVVGAAGDEAAPLHAPLC